MLYLNKDSNVPIRKTHNFNFNFLKQKIINSKSESTQIKILF